MTANEIVGAVGPTLTEAWQAILAQRETLAQLNELASRYPYYKYNQMWSRRMESVVRS